MIQDRIIPGKIKRVFHRNVRWYDEYGAEEGIARVVTGPDDAEVVTSLVDSSSYPGVAFVTEFHSPVLDIDIPAFLVPSSTPGHSHLYLDHQMTWRQYKALLKALGRARILEPGYVKASLRRKHTSVRVPWVRKEHIHVN